MKAIRVENFGEPDVLQLAEVPVPKLGPGQVLVRVEAAGVNPVDGYIRGGTYAIKPKLPYTPGTDAAGTIGAVADDVKEFQKGDRVYTSGAISGTYAEFALCEPAQVHRLPAGLSMSQGASLGVPYATAYRALVQRGRAKAAETVLIHGASGSVGTAAVQISLMFGLRIFGTAGTEEGVFRVTAQGAHQVFNHHSPDYLEKIKAATDGKGVDLIIEMLANVNLDKDLGLLADGGRVVVVGNRGEIKINPRLAMLRETDIRGMSLPHAPADERRAIYAGLAAGLDLGALRPFVGQELPLADAAESHRLVMKSGSQGKIVLLP